MIAVRSRRNHNRKIRDVLSDDAVWWNPNRRIREWAALLRFHPMSIKQDLLWRGWRRNNLGEITQAPCAVCHDPTSVDDLCPARKCPGCRIEESQLDAFGNNPVAVFRAELEKRRAS